MIYVIGTCHKTQIVNDQIRKGALGTVPLSKAEEFCEYLVDTAMAVDAVAVCEEMTAEGVAACGHNPISVAELAAKKVSIHHAFCEPDANDREKLGLRSGDVMAEYVKSVAAQLKKDFTEAHRDEVRKQFPVREKFWLSKILCFEPNLNNIIFICGADHPKSFVETAKHAGIEASVYCADWTELAKIPCPCCL